MVRFALWTTVAVCLSVGGRRSACCQAPTSLEDSFSELTAALDDDDLHVRIAALSRLDLLRAQLYSRNADELHRAAQSGDEAAGEMVLRHEGLAGIAYVAAGVDPSIETKNSLALQYSFVLTTSPLGQRIHRLRTAEPHEAIDILATLPAPAGDREALQQVLPPLLDAKDANLRRQALQTLINYGVDWTTDFSHVVRLTRDPDLRVRELAMTSAARAPSPQASIAAWLHDHDSATRTIAATMLTTEQAASAAVLPLLLERADSPDAEGEECVRALGRSASPRAAAKLVDMACDATNPRHESALAALEELGPAAASASIRLQLLLRHGGTRQDQVVRALAAIGPPARHAVRDLEAAFDPQQLGRACAILEALDAIDPTPRRLAFLLQRYQQLLENGEQNRTPYYSQIVGSSLEKLGPRGAPLAPLVAGRLADSSTFNSHTALRLLEAMQPGDEPTMVALARYAESTRRDWRHKSRAIQLIGRYGQTPPAASEILLRLAVSGSPEIQAAAIRACADAGVGAHELSPHFRQWQNSGRVDVDDAALHAMMVLGPDSIPPGKMVPKRLVPMLENQYHHHEAASALVAMGPAATAAVESLANRLNKNGDNANRAQLDVLAVFATTVPAARKALERVSTGDGRHRNVAKILLKVLPHSESQRPTPTPPPT
jgi:hypothetical protein